MSQTRHWIRDWLTDPPLGQYFRIHRSSADVNHSGSGLQSTKKLLKEHMVDSFFERALRHIDRTEPAPISELADAFSDYFPELEEENTESQHTVAAFNDSDTDLLDEPQIDEEYVSRTLAEVIHINDIILPDSPEEPFIAEDLFDTEEEVLVSSEEDIVNADEEQSSPFIEVEEELPQNGYYIFAITLSQYDYELPADQLAEGYPLFVYGFGKIQAVLSEVPLTEYGENALQLRLNDPTWFEQTLKKHNGILAQIQTVTSMVPMRLCTICDTSEALTSFLSEHHDDFVNTLELIEGNQSWSFIIACNRRKLHLLTRKASNRVRAIEAEISGKGGVDVQHLYEKLENVLDEEARSVCKACIKHSHTTLSSFASKNLIHSLSGEQDQDSDMQDIFKCEYLVPNQVKESFLGELHSLKESYKSLGFELQIDGPFPPSQFTERKVLPASEKAASSTEPPIRTTGTH